MRDEQTQTQRPQWGSRLGFILAAAGSAVGLGNIWKFPYITGENGGGAFVAVYLVSIAVVGLPIMLAETLLGRMGQSSTVGTYAKLSSPRSGWVLAGWLGVLAAFMMLSFYSVVAGWTLHYVWLALSGGLTAVDAEHLPAVFNALRSDGPVNIAWHVAFMALTMIIVLGGIQRGLERAARVLMPALLGMLAGLLLYCTGLDGFGPAFDFVFGFHAEALTRDGVLEALGHSFFTLSLGMGAMLTYGSYMRQRDDFITTSIAITLLDTGVALMACLVLFPITFSYGMEPSAGPGLVFQNIPVALSTLPGASSLTVIFFLLLTFAALTSAISLLEVVCAYFIDERGWTRRQATLVLGGAITLFGVPSALSMSAAPFMADEHGLVGRNWFDSLDYLVSNWMLPLGGLLTALFMAWRVGDEARRVAFDRGTSLGGAGQVYLAWLQLLRFLVPITIALVMLHAVGAL
ncbi:MAG: sodium-dependent transporter [Myxococcales bacterium FL481]|nr:MAG: sodium-dependent transporter [Myxococcales bacterium FL481]